MMGCRARNAATRPRSEPTHARLTYERPLLPILVHPAPRPRPG